MIKENKLYFAGVNGELYDSMDIKKAMKILTGKELNEDDEIRQAAKSFDGIKKELKNPSIKYLIKHGYHISAIKVLYERKKKTDPSYTLVMARDEIYRMKEEMAVS